MGWWRDRTRAIAARRAAVRREAEDLIAEFGAEAWHEAQDRAAARSLEDVGADPHPWCVARAVERRLGIRHQPDTATRSLL